MQHISISAWFIMLTFGAVYCQFCCGVPFISPFEMVMSFYRWFCFVCSFVASHIHLVLFCLHHSVHACHFVANTSMEE